jgi:hypothetical protein
MVVLNVKKEYYSMSRGKSTKLKPFQKLLTIMVSGKPVTVEEIDATLGKEIYMYRLSTYIWHIKTNANGVVKAIKDGRKVSAYQIVNVDQVKDYMKRAGITSASFVPGQTTKKTSISKLADLAAKPKKATVKKPAKTKTVTVEAVDELEVEEVQQAA